MAYSTMARPVLAVMCMLAVGLPAWAQADEGVDKTETVTVVGHRKAEVPAKIVEHFVDSFAATAKASGKYPRWRAGVCPLVVGMEKKYTDFVARRIREVAKQVGAPVARSKDCSPNILVVFSPRPQAALTQIGRDRYDMLGLVAPARADDPRVRFTHPIQALYATASSGMGGPIPDAPRRSSEKAPTVSVLDTSRLVDGLYSELYAAIVIADSNKVAGYKIGSVADYIAMMALSQTKDVGACREMSSVTNLLADGCPAARKTEELSAGDVAYLHALYHMSLEVRGFVQKGQMASTMMQDLKSE